MRRAEAEAEPEHNGGKSTGCLFSVRTDSGSRLVNVKFVRTRSKVRARSDLFYLFVRRSLHQLSLRLLFSCAHSWVAAALVAGLVVGPRGAALRLGGPLFHGQSRQAVHRGVFHLDLLGLQQGPVRPFQLGE